MKWDPSKYVEFDDHRNRPFFDLTARILADHPGKVVDLGCGPGHLTATLARRWPNARVIGLDSSREMLAQADAQTAHHPRLQFEIADVGAWRPDPDTDVVVSNAALQWVKGHVDLLPIWLEALRPGGWFALQVPGNFGAPSHVLMRELADSQRWTGKLRGVLQHVGVVAEPAQYLQIMLDAGCSVDVWETSYQQVLTGENPILEWVRGSTMRPVLAALTPEEGREFEQEYARLVARAYPPTAHGTVFPFRRIFAVARKAG